MKLAEQWRTSSPTTVYSMTSLGLIWRHAKEKVHAVQRRMSQTFFGSENDVICLNIHREIKGGDVGYLWQRCIFLTTTEQISIKVLNILTRNLQHAYMYM